MRDCEALAVREIVPRAACNFRCCPPSDKPCTRYPHVARRRAKSACMFRRLLCCFLLVLPTFCGTTPRALIMLERAPMPCAPTAGMVASLLREG